MTVRNTVRCLYAVIALTAFLFLAVATASEALPFLLEYAFLTVILVAVGQFLIRYPACGKNVFKVERRRTVGMSVGYHDWRAERVCSRCGTVLIPNGK